MKTENLRKTWMQGLLLAAVVAAALPIPDVALAQLSTASTNSQTQVFAPILQILSYASYVMGGVFVIAGAMKLKAHAENATQAPLQHGFSRIGVGAALLALPYLMGLANSTAQNTFGTTGSTFHAFGFD
jgi:hypothetical protein